MKKKFADPDAARGDSQNPNLALPKRIGGDLVRDAWRNTIEAIPSLPVQRQEVSIRFDGVATE